MKRKKLKNRLAKRVLAGKITVDDARRKLGRNMTQKSAVPALAKAGSARPAWQPPPAPRYVGDEEYLRSAFAPIGRPAVTKAAGPAPWQAPQQMLKSMRELAAVTEPPARPAHYWTGVDRALLRDSQENPDPRARENARATLAARVEGGVA
jgi:hypothetical protein